MTPSLSFVVVHLAIQGPLDYPLRASSLGYYPGGTVERAYDRDLLRTEDEDLFIGFGIPTLDDSSLAPAGQHIFSVHYLAPVDPSIDWTPIREPVANGLLERLEGLLPGLRQRILHRSIATPGTFERYTANLGGSAYGWEATPERWTCLSRLFADLPSNFFQVGHWGDYGGGTVSAIVSGHGIAQAIARGVSPVTRQGHHVG